MEAEVNRPNVLYIHGLIIIGFFLFIYVLYIYIQGVYAAWNCKALVINQPGSVAARYFFTAL